jgi:GTPase SAR1 family protein
MLVFDVTKPESLYSLETWYTEAIENIGYQVPTVILGNKDDLERKISDKDLKNPFIAKNSFPMYFTSAKTGNMVNQAFIDICNRIYTKYGSK